jgi:hypothetical protein
VHGIYRTIRVNLWNPCRICSHSTASIHAWNMNRSALTWDTLDWAALDRLRDKFLAAERDFENYWTSRSDLENYDFTFAQRIAWKWDAVLRELKLRGWTPPPGGPLLDWGCGSGIAGRRVAEFFGPECFSTLRVFDRSPLAVDFALAQAREAFPSLRAEAFHEPGADQPTPSPSQEGSAAEWPVPLLGGVRGGFSVPMPGEKVVEAFQHPARSSTGVSPASAPSVGTLILSHVLNELDEAGRRALRSIIDRAAAVLWVEPGTYADSRSLIAMHEALRDSFHIIAPCTHQHTCGLRTRENVRHWCHHFASPPVGIMADSNWVRFAQRAGIHLRSLPYSFLVLERKGLCEPVPGLLPGGWSRIVGAPRFYKGYAKIFSCQRDGVEDLTLQKRDAPELFRALKNGEALPFQRWVC